MTRSFELKPERNFFVSTKNDKISPADFETFRTLSKMSQIQFKCFLDQQVIQVR
jgi:hypothetical protein